MAARNAELEQIAAKKSYDSDILKQMLNSGQVVKDSKGSYMIPSASKGHHASKWDGNLETEITFKSQVD